MQSHGESYISDFVEMVVPFLSRLDELHPGTGRQCLSDYLTTLAKVNGMCMCMCMHMCMCMCMHMCMSMYVVYKHKSELIILSKLIVNSMHSLMIAHAG